MKFYIVIVGKEITFTDGVAYDTRDEAEIQLEIQEKEHPDCILAHIVER